MKIAELIVMVLLCHPTPAILEEPEVKKHRINLKKRYRELRNAKKDLGTRRFSDAEVEAKVEWVEKILSTSRL